MTLMLIYDHFDGDDEDTADTLIIRGGKKKTSSQAPSYASPSPKLSSTYSLADGGEV